jgi:hypothetical protein
MWPRVEDLDRPRKKEAAMASRSTVIAITAAVATAACAAALLGATPATARTTSHVLVPHSQHTYVCSSGYRPLTSTRPALRRHGEPLRRLGWERFELPPSYGQGAFLTQYAYGDGIVVVEGRTFRVVRNGSDARLKYDDRC